MITASRYMRQAVSANIIVGTSYTLAKISSSRVSRSELAMLLPSDLAVLLDGSTIAALVILLSWYIVCNFIRSAYIRPIFPVWQQRPTPFFIDVIVISDWGETCCSPAHPSL